jgi:hypothetical protein
LLELLHTKTGQRRISQQCRPSGKASPTAEEKSWDESFYEQIYPSGSRMSFIGNLVNNDTASKLTRMPLLCKEMVCVVSGWNPQSFWYCNKELHWCIQH